MRRLACHVATILLGVLAGCGGGGGGGGTPGLAVIELGALPGGEITYRTLRVSNPFSETATVTEISPSPPFQVRPGVLPLSLAAGASQDLTLQCVPVFSGAQAGIVVIEITAPSGRALREHEVRATFERVTWSILPASLGFGTVGLGTSADRSVVLTNTSATSPVTITEVELPSPDFSLVAPVLPVTIRPNEPTTFTLRYSPTTSGLDDGTLRIGPRDWGANLAVQVQAGEPPDPELEGEFVLNLGTLQFQSGLSQTLVFDLPNDARSAMLEVRGQLGDRFALESWLGPGAVAYVPRVYETQLPVKQGDEIYAFTIPDTDLIEGQPLAGTHQVVMRRLLSTGQPVTARVILERRPGAASTARLDLNVYLAQGLVPNQATAPSDARMQAILARTAAIFASQGITLGDVDWYDLGDPTFDRIAENELADLGITSTMALKTRANVWFVLGFDGNLNGLSGLSVRIGTPRAAGHRGAGVCVDVLSFADTDFVGAVMAHEIGHALGLFHDIEWDGTPDRISDTNGQPNLMDPVVTSWDLTPGQGHVLRLHPHLRPVPSGSAKPGVPAATQTPRGTGPGPSHTWCWHCREAAR